MRIMNEVQKKVVVIVNKSPNPMPSYAHAGDSGMDLRAWITDEEGGEITLKPLERKLIHTGVYVELPEYTEAQIRTRSGCALKQALVVLNSPGSIDNFYRNEIGIIAINLSNEDIVIRNGDRIAQMVICPVFLKELVEIKEKDEVSTNTERGTDGFGSTGLK